MARASLLALEESALASTNPKNRYVCPRLGFFHVLDSVGEGGVGLAHHESTSLVELALDVSEDHCKIVTVPGRPTVVEPEVGQRNGYSGRSACSDSLTLRHRVPALDIHTVLHQMGVESDRAVEMLDENEVVLLARDSVVGPGLLDISNDARLHGNDVIADRHEDVVGQLVVVAIAWIAVRLK